MERNISNHLIIALLELPRIGRKTAIKILKSLNHQISNKNDLLDFINEQSDELHLRKYSSIEIEDAFQKAEYKFEQSEKLGIKIISFLDEDYPKQLLAIDDFPIALSYKGDIKALSDRPNVAVVGTREPSEFGFKVGQRIAEVFSTYKLNIVSGLALGCDTAGHLGALKAHGTTTAVLAHGLDYIYPKENKELAETIVENGGLLISEYFVKQKPMANFFVERDRIQAGLSHSVVIVETDVKGGTMHTAKYCTEYRRKLICFNHPQEYRDHAKVQGNQMLIKEGKAIPIYSKDEIEILIFMLLNDFSNKKQDNPETVPSCNHYVDFIVNDSNQKYFFCECKVYKRDDELNEIYKSLATQIKDYININEIYANWKPNTFIDYIDFVSHFPKRDNKIYNEFYSGVYENLIHLCSRAHSHLSHEIDPNPDKQNDGKQIKIWE